MDADVVCAGHFCQISGPEVLTAMMVTHRARHPALGPGLWKTTMTQSRRDFLIVATATATLGSIGASVRAQRSFGEPKGATAITEVFGDGVRLTMLVLEYDRDLRGAGLSPASFGVEGRTVTDAFVSKTADPTDRTDTGRFVVIALSPEDEKAALTEKPQPNGGEKAAPPGHGGPGKAGDPSTHDAIYRAAEATLVQSGSLETAKGEMIAPSSNKLTTTKVRNLIVDEFEQRKFQDPKTGRVLNYNLFIPKTYDPTRIYPIVLFMHDAGATSDITTTTLFQGLGAVVWAAPENQAERPCFVLAPQYAEIIADDDSKTSNMLDTTIDLVDALTRQYSIDRSRIYATGQSGGCMMAIAMNIKYPAFFAASFLVAGQWDPALVQPLVKQRLWVLVSQDDDKAYPGENAMTDVLEKHGAKISRAVWDGTWTTSQFRTAFETIDAEDSPINYVAFRKGTVIPAGQSAAGASGHRNTWRIAYTIKPIREWLFRQHR